VWNIPE